MSNSLFPKLLTTRAAWMVGLGALVIGGVASGQARRPDATLDELVVEVQALRAELNLAAATSIKAQLLVGRLQIEDQRIAAAMRDLESVQNELATGAQGRADAAAREKRLEDALIASTGAGREEIEQQLEAAKATSDLSDRRHQMLKQRESALVSELQEDQARWMDINARLESVEQALPGQNR